MTLLVKVAPTVLVLNFVAVVNPTLVVVGVGIVRVEVYWPLKTVAGGRVDVLVDEENLVRVTITAGAYLITVVVCKLVLTETVTVGLSAARR